MVILRPSTVVPVVKTVPEIVAAPPTLALFERRGPCTPPPEPDPPVPPAKEKRELEVDPEIEVADPLPAVVL